MLSKQELVINDFLSEFKSYSEGLESLSYILRCCIDEKAQISNADIRGIGILLEIYNEKQNQLIQGMIKGVKEE